MFALETFAYIFISITILCFALFKVALKKFSPNRFIFFFWINLFAYAEFISFRLLQQIFLKKKINVLDSITLNFSPANLHIYFIIAILSFFSLIILRYLMIKYELSKIMLILQLSHVFKFLLFYTPSIIKSFGALSITAGIIVTLKCYKKSAIKNITLFVGAGLEFIIITCVTFLTKICSMEKGIIKITMNSLKNLESFPFSLFNPIHFNVAVRIITLLAILTYLIFKVKKIKNIFKTFLNNKLYIFTSSLLYLVAAYSYQTAYALTYQHNTISKIASLSVPTTIIFACLLLKEEKSKEKIIGTFLVLAGLIIIQ